MIKQCTSNNWRIQVPRLKGGINVKQKEGKWLKLGNIIKKFQDTKNKGKNTELTLAVRMLWTGGEKFSLKPV